MPDRGEVWLAELDPGEQGGTRPVLVVSTKAFNAWPVGLVIVVPITTRDRGFAHHVGIAGSGLDRSSFAMPE
jgi:mRNA interferase MazF